METSSNCEWSAFSNDEFVTVADGSSGTGIGEVLFALKPNKSWERELAVFVAGESYLAEQSTAKERRRETPVCDRSPPMRDALVWETGKPCGEIGTVDLAAIRDMGVSWWDGGREWEEEWRLASGDLDGLTGPVDLYLGYSFLAGLLPSSTFEGLSKLITLDLRGNPGTPFALVPQLVRSSEGTARISAKIAQGAPFDMKIPLSVSGGSLSSEQILIEAGEVRSGQSVSVSQDGDEPVEVWTERFDIPRRFYGLTTATGTHLFLFGLKDRKLPGNGMVMFDLPTAFPGFGEGAAYSVESDSKDAVDARISKGILTVVVFRGGVVNLTVTATSRGGDRSSMNFRIDAPKTLPIPRIRWRGGRLAALMPDQSKEEGSSPSPPETLD